MTKTRLGFLVFFIFQLKLKIRHILVLILSILRQLYLYSFYNTKNRGYLGLISKFLVWKWSILKHFKLKSLTNLLAADPNSALPIATLMFTPIRERMSKHRKIVECQMRHLCQKMTKMPYLTHMPHFIYKYVNMGVKRCVRTSGMQINSFKQGFMA